MGGKTTYFGLPTVHDSDTVDGAAQITALANASDMLFSDFAGLGNISCLTYTDSTALTALYRQGTNVLLKIPSAASSQYTYRIMQHRGSSSSISTNPARTGGLWLAYGEMYLVFASVCFALSANETVATGIGVGIDSETDVANYGRYCEVLTENPNSSGHYASTFHSWIIGRRDQTSGRYVVAPFFRSSSAPNLIQSATIVAMQLTSGELESAT